MCIHYGTDTFCFPTLAQLVIGCVLLSIVLIVFGLIAYMGGEQ